MNFRLKCEKPGDIQYTLTATMSAEEWERVREFLDKSSPPSFEPAGVLRNAISDLLAQARKIYWHEGQDAHKT